MTNNLIYTIPFYLILILIPVYHKALDNLDCSLMCHESYSPILFQDASSLPKQLNLDVRIPLFLEGTLGLAISLGAEIRSQK